MKARDVTIITGTCNNFRFLSLYLKTLCAYTVGNFKLIIVDNGSDPQTDKLLLAYKQDILHDRLTILQGNQDWSFARFNNEAIPFVTTPLVLFANDDIVFVPGWLPSMLNLIKRDVGAVGKQILDWDGNITWHRNEHIFVDETPATCLLVRREFAMFDTGFVGYYMEDIALCKKIRGLGFKIAIDYLTPIRHFGKATFSKKENQADLISANDVHFRTLFKKPLTYR